MQCPNGTEMEIVVSHATYEVWWCPGCGYVVLAQNSGDVPFVPRGDCWVPGDGAALDAPVDAGWIDFVAQRPNDRQGCFFMTKESTYRCYIGTYFAGADGFETALGAHVAACDVTLWRPVTDDAVLFEDRNRKRETDDEDNAM